ncbi:MAG: hypothetical protein KGS61_03195 [Verrucomicrobia bacterium]|nr:hypothetical protein [Verrucomicrobiota bacterium]
MLTLEPRRAPPQPQIERWRRRVEAFELDEHPIVRALAISLAFHLFVFGTWKVGHHYGIWQRASTPRWLEKILRLPVNALAPNVRKQLSPPARELELKFVDVDPRVATAQPPKDTRLFSALNSHAANPDTRRDSNKPQVDGKQTQVLRTFDQTRPNRVPPPPTPKPVPKPAAAEQKRMPEPKTAPANKSEPQELTALAKPKPAPGNLAAAQPLAKPPAAPETGDAEEPRMTVAPADPPRTLAEARLRQGILAGQKMKQDGGVRQFNVESSLDVQQSALGEYAAEMIAAVQQRWYDLLDEHHYSLERSGKVVLEFRLNEDGAITELKVRQSDVGDFYAWLCQKAVQDPSPYRPWPRALRLDVGATFKVVKFTFYYN